jgi:hypothetical protein
VVEVKAGKDLEETVSAHHDHLQGETVLEDAHHCKREIVTCEKKGI